MKNKNNKTRNQVMEEIKKGRVKIRSRFSIWAIQLGLNSGVFLVLLILIFSIAALMFWFNTNQDVVWGNYYGRYRLGLFLENLPYLLVMLFIIAFVLLSAFIKKYDFSYKKPFLIILSSILAITIIFSWVSLRYPQTHFLLARTPLLFGERITKGHNFVVGEVVAKQAKALTVRTNKGENIIVLINKQTLYPQGTIEVGDLIRTIGLWDEDENLIKAYVIGDLQHGPGAKMRQFLKPSFAPTPGLKQKQELKKKLRQERLKHFRQPN